jgi:hypothetical protein
MRDRLPRWTVALIAVCLAMAVGDRCLPRASADPFPMAPQKVGGEGPDGNTHANAVDNDGTQHVGLYCPNPDGGYDQPCGTAANPFSVSASPAAPTGPYPKTTAIQLSSSPTLVPPGPAPCPSQISLLEQGAWQAWCVPAQSDGGLPASCWPTVATVPAALADANSQPINSSLPVTFCTDSAQAFRQLACCSAHGPYVDGGAYTEPDGGSLTYWVQ